MADAPVVDTPAPTGESPAPAAAPTPDATGTTLLTQGDTPAPADKPADTPADKPAPVIPESYEFKAIEGVPLDAEFGGALTPVLKELGISAEGFAKLQDAYNGYAVKAIKAEETKREAEFTEWMGKTVKGYQDAIRKEWGHEFDGNLKVAQRGLSKLFDAEGKKLLDETGLGSHPAFVKAFYQVGKLIKEDAPPVGGQPNGRKSNAEVFYGSQPAA